MQVLIFTLLLCCEVFGRPSDPVIREFGTQPNNPNVKVFSTYPTLQPPVIKDNPNDLEKGPDQEKYQKDEAEVTETKGEEITKAQSNLTDSKILSQLENVPEDNILEGNSTEGELVDNDNSFQRDSSAISVNENAMENSADDSMTPNEDAQPVNETTVNAAHDLTNNPEMNPQIEMETRQDSEVGSVPVTEDIVVPISEADLIGPLVIDAPVTIIPSIAEELGEIPEEEILFAIPDMDINEDEIYELNEEEPLFNSGGVFLPALGDINIPANVGDDEILPMREETAPFLPPIAEQSVPILPPIAEESEGKMNVKTDLPREVPGSIQKVTEMTKEAFEPIASLVDETAIINPIVEQEEEFNHFDNPNGEPATTDDNIAKETSMGEGDVGASLSMIKEIPPVVEAESDLPSDPISTSDVEPKDETVIVAQENGMGGDEGIKTDDNSTNETLVEETTGQSVQMAGFMSDALKSTESEKTTEETVPSATDLPLIVNIKDNEQNSSPVISEDTPVLSQLEPMDQLDVIDSTLGENNSTPTSVTEESVPTLNPVELTADEETNDDPTLNEAI